MIEIKNVSKTYEKMLVLKQKMEKYLLLQVIMEQVKQR